MSFTDLDFSEQQLRLDKDHQFGRADFISGQDQLRHPQAPVDVQPAPCLRHLSTGTWRGSALDPGGAGPPET